MILGMIPVFVSTRFVFADIGSRRHHWSFWHFLLEHLYGFLLTADQLCTSGCCIYGYCFSGYFTSRYCTCIRTAAVVFLLISTVFWMISSLPFGARIHPVSLLLTKEAFILVTGIEYVPFKILEMQRAGDFLLHIHIYAAHTSVCVEGQLNRYFLANNALNLSVFPQH